MLVNGTLDLSYGNAGKVPNQFAILNTRFPGDSKAAMGDCVAVQPDQKLLTAGLSVSDCFSRLYLTRFKTDGRPDSTFGDNGLVMLPFGGFINQIYSARKILPLPDGKILLAINYSNLTENCLGGIRLLSDGTVDSMYGINGLALQPNVFRTDFPFFVGADMDEAGRLYFAGTHINGADTVMGVSRLQPGGQIDSTFGVSGLYLQSFGTSAVCQTMVVQAPGRLLLGGYTRLSAEGELRGIVLHLSNATAPAAISGIVREQATISVHPNPSDAQALLSFSLPQQGACELYISDMQGKIIFRQSLGRIAAGAHRIPLPGTERIPAGIYTVSLSTGQEPPVSTKWQVR